MEKFFINSVFFGAVISLAAYEAGLLVKRKFKLAILNPLLLAMISVMAFLVLFDIDYDHYNEGARYISYLLTPATVCLAVPLYEQLTLLKKNFRAVIAGILSGVLASLISILGFSILFGLNHEQYVTLLMECKKEGHPDMVYKFSSTSKISFPGSGIGAIAASDANLADIRKQMRIQTIGHDKLNQLRHARYFKTIHGMVEHMKRHADILRPKFDIVLDTLEKELGGLEIGSWLAPRGGYFISFDSLDGCAKAIVEKAKEAGLVMTDAGATFPYGKDPHDSNIRIAPSYPTVEELKTAVEIFTLSVKLVSIDKILSDMLGI